MAINTLATRYGKTPIDIVYPEKGYSEFEGIMFNAFVANVSLTEEKRKADEMERKSKLKRMSKR